MSLDNNFSLKSIKEVTSYISRGVTPSYTEEEGVSVINQRCIRNNSIDYENIRLTDPNKRKIPKDKYLKKHDVLVNSTGVGTLGRSAQIKELKEPTTVDSHVTILRPNDIIDPLFFGYAIQMLEKNIENLAEGSTGQTELSRVRLGDEIFINYLPKDSQKKIGNMLSNIDKKIEILNKINKNLEELSTGLAINIFKKNDKETIELKEICKFIKGRKPKEISEIKENNFLNYLTIDVLTNQNNSYAFDEKGIKANEYDILMVMDGASSGKLFYGKNGLVGSTLAKLETDKKYQEIVYQFLKINEPFICENTTGTAIPHTDKGLVLNLQCPLSADILKFSEIFKTIRSSIISNTNEIAELQKLRDTLLPKLMSGDIDVSEVNCDLD